ncbi:MAG: alpha/beta hydrolase [Dehalococcoidia bacterium]|nr:alpha/beta hydrolase [Dehalococcoidia bacterium]
MPTFVLVHGGHMGGWCWNPVRAHLQKQGHTVYTPTLTGCGDRSHLASPNVTMETHVQDITSFLYSYDLKDIVLVGHSYGTWICTQVVDQMPERIGHMVCLDGQLFRDGEGGMTNRTEEQREQLRRLAQERGEGWKLPPPPRRTSLFNDFSDEVWAWVEPRMAPMNLSWFEAPCKVKRFFDLGIPGTMIRCAQSPFNRGGDNPAVHRAQELGWTVEWIDAGHYCMCTRPADTAEALHQVAFRSRL